MEQLTTEQRIDAARFADMLSQVQTVEDMFPPEAGVYAELPETDPRPPLCDQICLAAVYDLAATRRRKEALLQRSGAMLLKIDELVGA